MNIGDAVTGRASGSVSGGRRYTHALIIMAITDPTPDRNSTTAIHPEEDAFASVRLMVAGAGASGRRFGPSSREFADCKDSGQSEYDAEGFHRECPSLRNGYGDLA
jgi:hypothetical protein